MKKLFLALILGIFLISFASAALPFDNIKQYDENSKTITIKNTFLWIPTSTVASIKLLTPEHNIIWGTGYQRVAELEINNVNEYSNALEKVEFYKMYFGLQKLNNKGYDYKYKTTKTITEDIIGCPNKDQKPGEPCKLEKIGTQERIVDDWITLNISNPLPAGKTIIGVYYNDVKINETVEWIMTAFGFDLTEWTDFIGAERIEWFNTGATSYYLSTPARKGGQTFTPGYLTAGDWNLVGVGLSIKRAGNPGTITISIYNTTGAWEQRLPTGTALVQNTTVNADNFDTNYRWENITMPAFHFVNGSTYALVIENTPAAEVDYENLDSNGYGLANGTYGRCIDNAGAGWGFCNANNYDNYFEVYATAFTSSSTANVTTQLISPLNNYNTTLTSLIFNASINVTGNANLTNATLFVYNSSGQIFNTQTNDLINNLSIYTNWTVGSLIDQTYNWSVRGCGINESLSTICNFADANFTFTIDTQAPNLHIYFPNGTLSSHAIGDTLELNYSASDTHLQTCWYNYGGINTIIACNANNTFVTTTQRNLTLYANDSLNNINSAYTSWDYAFLEGNQSFNPNVITGTYQFFNISVYMANPPALPYLIYNGTSHLGTITNLGGNDYLLINSFSVPSVSTQTNYTFFWSIMDSIGTTYNTSISNQTVNVLQIDNCTTYSNSLFNFTQRDEDTQAILDGAIENSSINMYINIYDSVIHNLLGSVNLSYSGNSNPKFCIGNDLINSSINIEGIVEQSATRYIHEFYYLSNYTITNKLFNLDLYDLLISRSQEFLVNYKDDNFLPAKDVLVYVTRQYIAEGVFKTVEVVKTDNNGQALVHLVLGDVIYTFVFVDSHTNQVTSILSNYVPFCENIVTGQCIINSNAFQTSGSMSDYSTLGGVTFKPDFNQTNRSISVTFISLSGASSVNQTVVKYDRFGNTTICSDELTSPSGMIRCNIPTTYGDVSLLVSVYSNGLLISEKVYSIGSDPTTIYSTEGVLFAILIIITLSMIFITSPIGIVVAAIVGLIISGLLGLLVTGAVFGGTIIIWIIISAAFLIWKINKGESK